MNIPTETKIDVLREIINKHTVLGDDVIPNKGDKITLRLLLQEIIRHLSTK